MNQVMNNLLTRRSTRSFEEKSLPREYLEQIIKAGLYAPSVMGRQTWLLTAILDTDKIQTLAAAIGKELGRDGYDMYRPTALVIPSNLRDSKFGMEDNACALVNFSL